MAHSDPTKSFPLVLLWLASSCSSFPQQAPEHEAPVQGVREHSALGETTCLDVPADAVINGLGGVESGTSYGSQSCTGGYVVDIDAYAPADTAGTVVAYAGPNDADVAACESTNLSVYAWRKNFETGAFEPLLDKTGNPEVQVRGEVYTGLSGEPLCARPRVTLDRRFPLFLPGGDYRVAFRVERAGQSERATLVTPELFDTPSTLLAEVQLFREPARWSSLADEMASLPTSKRAQECRFEALEVEVVAAFAQAWTSVGASETTVESFVANRRGLYANLCDELIAGQIGPDFDAFGRGAVDSYLGIVDQVGRAQILDRELANRLMVRMLNDVAHEQMSQCSPEQSTLANYLFLGASVPQGLQAALFPGCGGLSGAVGGASRNARDIANALVDGQGLGGTFQRCVNDAIAKEIDDGICSDPRADGTEWGGQPLSEEEFEQCLKYASPDLQTQCVEEAQRRKSEEQNAAPQAPPPSSTPENECEGPDMVCSLALDVLNSKNLPSAEDIRNTRAGSPFTSQYWSTMLKSGLKATEIIAGVVEDMTPVVVSGVKSVFKSMVDLPHTIFTKEAEEAARQGISVIHEQQLREYCPYAPSHPKCKGLEELERGGGGNKRCLGEQLGVHMATYLTGGDFSQSAGEQSMTGFDRMDACYCEYMGRPLYGEDCMSPQERERQDCINNPFGPDDGPRRECAQYMRSTALDPTQLRAALCQYMRPNEDCTPVLGDSGQCMCVETLQPGEVEAKIGQEICGKVQCNPLSAQRSPHAIFDVRTGCCQELGFGEGPIAPSTPGCVQPSAPDLTDFWQGVDLDAVVPGTIFDLEDLEIAGGLTRPVDGGRTLQFYRPGYTGAVGPLVTREQFPELDLATFDTSGLNLSVEVLRAASNDTTPPRVQAFCTSSVLENRLLGEVSLGTLQPGQFGEVQIPVDSTLMQDCLPYGEAAGRIGFAVESGEAVLSRNALGNYTITRSSTPAWVEPTPTVCPVDPITARQVFEVNVSPDTSVDLNLGQIVP